MYGIFTYICHKQHIKINYINVGRYTIHGSYGYHQSVFFHPKRMGTETKNQPPIRRWIRLPEVSGSLWGIKLWEIFSCICFWKILPKILGGDFWEISDLEGLMMVGWLMCGMEICFFLFVGGMIVYLIGTWWWWDLTRRSSRMDAEFIRSLWGSWLYFQVRWLEAIFW